MSLIVSGSAAIVMMFSAYGWGRGAEMLIGLRWAWPMTAALGIAALIFIGGIVNSAAIAIPIVIDGIWVIGLIIGVLSLVKGDSGIILSFKLCEISIPSFDRILTNFLIGTLFVFGVTFYALPSFLNPFDDLEKYLAFPIRMLATGSVSSGPFSALGAETFIGGQAFLQGVLASHFPLQAINILDSIVSFTLCLFVVDRAASSAHYSKLISPLLIGATAFFNPQWVNISAVYTGSLLCLLILVLPLGGQISGPNSERPDITSIRYSIVIGLLYAAIVSLKTSFIVFAASHFLFTSILLILQGLSIGQYLKWVGCTGSAGFLFILPWILVNVGQWVSWPLKILQKGEVRIADQIPVAAAPNWPASITQEVFYGFGESYLHYFGLLASLVIVSLAILLLCRNNLASNPLAMWSTVSSMTMILFVVILVGFVGRYMIGQDTGLRLSMPVVIAAVPAGLIFVAAVGRREAKAVIIFSLCALIFFGPSFVQRSVQAVEQGNIFSIRQMIADKNMIDVVADGLSNSTKRKIQFIQEKTPPNKLMLAWITTPFHLDYSRNPIFDVHTKAGLLKWSNDFPYEVNHKIVTKYLLDKGVEYVFLQYRGGTKRGMKSLIEKAQSPYSYYRRASIREIILTKAMFELGKVSQIIYRDANYILFRITS